MDCKQFEEGLSDYIDGDIQKSDKEALEQHMASCDECRDKYEYLINMLDELHHLPPLEVPVDIKQNTMNNVRNKKRKKRFPSLNTKKVLSYAAVFILGIFVVSMGSFVLPLINLNSGSDMAMDESSSLESSDYGITNSASDGDEMLRGEDDIENDSIPEEESNTTLNEVFDKEKIIYEGSINLNVADAQEITKQISTYIESQGGFVQNAYMHGENSKIEDSYSQSYITVRIPSEKFKTIMEDLKEYGEETNSNFNSTNITTQYRNLESELESLQIQEERLLTYLEEASKMEDMLTIESELNRVRTHMNRINTQLKNFDQKVSYSSITVYLTESKTMTTTIQSPFGQLLSDIAKGFISSINALLQLISFLIVLLVKIVPFLVLIVPVWLLVKKFVLKR